MPPQGPREGLGLVIGLIGVCVFAGTLPFTRIAVEHLSPGFITAGRASMAGLLAGTTLLALRKPWPARAAIRKLALAALCLVGGFGVVDLAQLGSPFQHRARRAVQERLSPFWCRLL